MLITPNIDHCADLLRQKIMCDADVGLIPQLWIRDRSIPWPVFSTVHQCRDFDAVLDWVDEHQVRVPEGFDLVKPKDAYELPSPP